jgi:hypothetical protein
MKHQSGYSTCAGQLADGGVPRDLPRLPCNVWPHLLDAILPSQSWANNCQFKVSGGRAAGACSAPPRLCRAENLPWPERRLASPAFHAELRFGKWREPGGGLQLGHVRSSHAPLAQRQERVLAWSLHALTRWATLASRHL